MRFGTFLACLNNVHVQVGIVSAGICGSSTDPSIYARLESPEILNFIKTHVMAKSVPNSDLKAK